MRVLVADKFEKSGLDGLAAIGCEVFSEPALKDEALAKRVAELEPEVLIVRSTPVGEPVLAVAELVADRRGRLFVAKAELRTNARLVLAYATGKYLPIKEATPAEMAADFVGEFNWVFTAPGT